MSSTPSEFDLLSPSLKQIPMFLLLSGRELEELASEARLVKYEPGEYLMEEGATGDCAFVLLKGRVEVTKAGVGLGFLTQGDCVGEVALLDASARSATVKALEPIVAVRLGHDTFERLLDRPIFVKSLLLALTNKLRQSVEFQVESEKARRKLLEELARFLEQEKPPQIAEKA
ncbi:MAG: cyclic nucleotide-binding domain-containing protein [Candidatus Wallbacteria bacterium]|nr:cyclic nucleotide-binding domain-containing protein [Candidatus Wallbacteria bacterium]